MHYGPPAFLSRQDLSIRINLPQGSGTIAEGQKETKSWRVGGVLWNVLVDKTDGSTHDITAALETVQDQAVSSARVDERGFTRAEEMLAIHVPWEKRCHAFKGGEPR